MLERERKSAKKKKEISLGTCSFDRTAPPQDALTGSTKVLNVVLPFEEALKLNFAIHACS
jgi:hypothetical protein